MKEGALDRAPLFLSACGRLGRLRAGLRARAWPALSWLAPSSARRPRAAGLAAAFLGAARFGAAFAFGLARAAATRPAAARPRAGAAAAGSHPAHHLGRGVDHRRADLVGALGRRIGRRLGRVLRLTGAAPGACRGHSCSRPAPPRPSPGPRRAGCAPSGSAPARPPFCRPRAARRGSHRPRSRALPPPELPPLLPVVLVLAIASFSLRNRVVLVTDRRHWITVSPPVRRISERPPGKVPRRPL